MSRILPAAVVAVVIAALLSHSPVGAGAAAPILTGTQTLVAPDAGATNFANSTSPFASVPRSAAMDAFRAVAPADLGGSRVAYVFTRDTSTDVWSHSATIPAPAGASTSWGNSVSVHGPRIAIADPQFPVDPDRDNYGRVQVFDLDGSSWVESQVVELGGSFRAFAHDVWLGSDALIIREAIYCDGDCSSGRYHQYERNGGSDFVLTDTVSGVDTTMVAGADVKRMVIGVPGFYDPFGCDPVHSRLRVIDTGSDPATTMLDLVEENTQFCGPLPPFFRQVDISGDVVVWESCCDGTAELDIRRFDGTAYVAEQTVPMTALSDGLAAIPNAILRADLAGLTFSSLLFDGTQWTSGAAVPMPADTVSRTPILAAQHRVGVVGNESLHIMSFEVPLTCLNLPVTVDLGYGGVPTGGDDVIFGTPFADTVDAGAGNDVVCGFGGDDDISGGPGGDILLGYAGADTLEGGDGGDLILGFEGVDAISGEGDADILVGGSGGDAISGGPGDDLIAGQRGADTLDGDGGDDLIFGGRGADAMDGGSETDSCAGGLHTDTAVNCEVVSGVP